MGRTTGAERTLNASLPPRGHGTTGPQKGRESILSTQKQQQTPVPKPHPPPPISSFMRINLLLCNWHSPAVNIPSRPVRPPKKSSRRAARRSKFGTSLASFAVAEGSMPHYSPTGRRPTHGISVSEFDYPLLQPAHAACSSVLFVLVFWRKRWLRHTIVWKVLKVERRLFGGCLSSHPNTTARAKTPQPIGGCAACQTAHFCIGIFH